MTAQKSGMQLKRISALMAVILALSCIFSINANAAADYCATWTEYKKVNNTPKGVTWNYVVDAMETVLDSAYELYTEGEANKAFTAINDAYYGYYEITGFEKVTMGAISGARVTKMELQFRTCKSKIKANSSNDEVKGLIDELRTMLREDANTLDGTNNSGGSSGENESTDSNGFNMVNFLACFGIILREGFEAILVVGAIIAYLVKSGNKDKLKPVYIGSIAAVIASFGAAWLLDALKLSNSANQEIIEGVTALIAVAVLFYVSNWMVSKSESEAWTKYIKNKVSSSVSGGSMVALGFTAFLAVFREGAEVILFYQPLIADSEGSTLPVWLGFGLGCVCLVFVYILIRFFSVKLPLKPFFLGTSILMFLMSISFLGSGIKELIEGDLISMTSPEWLQFIPSNDIFDVLGVYPVLETIIPQLILLAITIVTFIIQIRRNNKIKAEVQAESESNPDTEEVN